jgi:ATPase family associated with various cellular activities (AAA)
MSWQEFNTQYLSQEIFRLQQQLEKLLDPNFEITPLLTLVPETQTNDFPMPALETLCKAFELSDFEKEILVSCASAEINHRCCYLLGQISGNPDHSFPSLSLALNISQYQNSGIFDRNLPLFRWQLVHILSNKNLITAPLKIDPWVLQYLMGYDYQDPSFPITLHPIPLHPSHHPLPACYRTVLDPIHLQWDSATAPPITQLCGTDAKAHHYIAAQITQGYGYQLMHLDAAALPTDPALFQSWLHHWKRQSHLHDQALLLEIHPSAFQTLHFPQTLAQLIAVQQTPLFLSLEERLPNYPNALSLDIPELTLSDQKQQWAYHLGPYAPQLNGHIGTIVAQFNVTLHNIETITSRALTQLQHPKNGPKNGKVPKPLPELVWQICCTESRSRLEGLAERIEPKTTWDDLILPPLSQKALKLIISTCQHRSVIYDEWGMGGNTRRGMGITSLFYGPSGTGKTTAAEIIAHDLKLDLYRVDLSQVSSKYIGETEKNLQKIFEAAQQSGAVLLFDEADAIIGKRSEVKESRDQYANQTVGYLLQAMEQYSGLAILTTNLPNALDTAFNRRIKYRIRFEYPTQEQRVKIWEKNFPATVPTKNLSFVRLGQAVLSGAIIGKAATQAGFLARMENEPVQMKHARQAIVLECLAEGRPLTPEETYGWES